jgi:hypothetical protein
MWNSTSNTITIGSIAFNAANNITMSNYNQDYTKLVVVGN